MHGCAAAQVVENDPSNVLVAALIQKRDRERASEKGKRPAEPAAERPAKRAGGANPEAGSSRLGMLILRIGSSSETDVGLFWFVVNFCRQLEQCRACAWLSLPLSARSGGRVAVTLRPAAPDKLSLCLFQTGQKTRKVKRGAVRRMSNKFSLRRGPRRSSKAEELRLKLRLHCWSCDGRGGDLSGEVICINF